jgi:hypothetical protein
MRLPLLLAACLAAAVLAVPGEARAGIFVGAELDGGHGIAMPAGTEEGVGFLGTLGYRIGIGPVFLQPELQGGYLLFPVEGADAAHVARVLGGARFGRPGMIQPSIFGHVGAGWLDGDTNGIACDAGVALALRLIPLLSFGAQAAYNVVTITSTGGATKWVGYGVHVAVEI